MLLSFSLSVAHTPRLLPWSFFFACDQSHGKSMWVWNCRQGATHVDARQTEQVSIRWLARHWLMFLQAGNVIKPCITLNLRLDKVTLFFWKEIFITGLNRIKQEFKKTNDTEQRVSSDQRTDFQYSFLYFKGSLANCSLVLMCLYVSNGVFWTVIMMKSSHKVFLDILSPEESHLATTILFTSDYFPLLSFQNSALLTKPSFIYNKMSLLCFAMMRYTAVLGAVKHSGVQLSHLKWASTFFFLSSTSQSRTLRLLNVLLCKC